MIKNEIRSLIDGAEPSYSSFWATGNCLEIPVFGSTMMSLRFEKEQVDIESMVDVICNLMQFPVLERKHLETYIVKEYLTSVENCSADFESAQAQLDWEADSTDNFENPVVPVTNSDIWSLVSFRLVLVRKSRLTKKTMAYVFGETAWDGEHGIALCFENGQMLKGVSDP